MRRIFYIWEYLKYKVMKTKIKILFSEGEIEVEGNFSLTFKGNESVSVERVEDRQAYTGTAIKNWRENVLDEYGALIGGKIIANVEKDADFEEDFLNGQSTYDILYSGFYWKKSNEGFNYWDRLVKDLNI
jgi:hypothetical protein